MKNIILALALSIFCQSWSIAAYEKQLAEAPQHYTEVTQEWQRYLGRDPLPIEKLHFGAYLADGHTVADLDNFLLTTTEYKAIQAYYAQQQRARDYSVNHESSFSFAKLIDIVVPIALAVLK